MKKFNFLFIALVLVLTSCSSDDSNDSPDISGDILGTWEALDVDYSGSSSTEFEGESFTSTFVGEAYDVDYTLMFTENPNELVADGSYSVELTTTVLGQTQVDNVENLEFVSNGTWSKSGDELTIVSQGETAVYTIVELTDTTLKMAIQTVEEVNDSGFSYSVEVDLLATYTRL